MRRAAPARLDTLATTLLRGRTMNRKTLLAGAVFAGLLADHPVRRSASPEKGTRTGEGPRPIAAIGEGNVDTLEITKDGKKTVIKKDGASFKVDRAGGLPGRRGRRQAGLRGHREAGVRQHRQRPEEQTRRVRGGRQEPAGGGQEGRQGAGRPAHRQGRPTTRPWCASRARTRSGRRWARIKWQLRQGRRRLAGQVHHHLQQNDAERLEVVSKTGGKIVLSPAAQERRRRRPATGRWSSPR